MSSRSPKPFPVALVVAGVVLGVLLLVCGGLGLFGYWILSKVSPEMAKLATQRQTAVVQNPAGPAQELPDDEAFQQQRKAWHVRATMDVATLVVDVAPQNGFPGGVPWLGLARVISLTQARQPH